MNHILMKAIYAMLYFGSPNWDSGQTPPEIMEVIDSSDPGRALDLGCGTGTHVIALAKHGWEAIGVDYVGKAIRRAKLRANAANLSPTFYTQDVTELDNIEGQFDLILDVGCYHTVDRRKRIAYRDNLQSLLKQGGLFLSFAFRKGVEQKLMGLTEKDIDELSNILELVSRRDGLMRGKQPITWLTYRKS